ncbi:DUF6456 domain-containing protein [Inquilinus sp. Marseille-Q2685]|uniref:DUF6456 domain-containing protein n=1 Tax=Inquilinus sp. Marseille-Q2685 TaxID=2866581 RepID=UPI001CE4A8E0|nr:DUF6456 domain-containing protein [Inquilinus sp. Marseille-Q2685]
MARHRIRRGRTAAAGEGMRETPERARHAAGIVDRPTGTAIGAPVGRLVQAPVDRLAARGSISPRMHSAGQQLRRQFEIGVLGVQDRGGEVLPGIRGTGLVLTPGEAQLGMLRTYKAALHRLGPYVGAVVEAVCCQEQDVVEVSARQGRSRDKVMGVLEDGLKTLADHYGLAGRDAPPPAGGGRGRGGDPGRERWGCRDGPFSPPPRGASAGHGRCVCANAMPPPRGLRRIAAGRGPRLSPLPSDTVRRSCTFERSCTAAVISLHRSVISL